MTILDQQLEILRGQFAALTVQGLPSGTTIVVIPELKLPAGWSKSQTRVKFLVPVGYPFAKPDCFWADVDLRLMNGNMPQNCNLTPIPETTEALLWFSWHTSQWNPNRDNLSTYFRVIEKRLREAK